MATDMELFDSPEEALANLILHPEKWPESVDFWIDLAYGGGLTWPSLACGLEPSRRPYFDSPWHIRSLREHSVYSYCGADYWFVARFVEALVSLGVMFDIIPGDGTPARTVNLLTASSTKLTDHMLIRRKSSWAKDFLLIRDYSVLAWLGIQPIECQKKYKAKILVTRLSHKAAAE